MLVSAPAPSRRHELMFGTFRAALTFPITIGQPGVTALANFDLDNPFRVSINLLSVVANATYKGMCVVRPPRSAEWWIADFCPVHSQLPGTDQRA